MNTDPNLISQVIQQTQRDSDLLKNLLNYDETISSFEHLLRNERYDANSEAWISQGKPFLNKSGINTIITIILTHLNNVFVMTNFTDDDVYRIAEELGHDITDLLYLKYIEWEAKVENLSIISTTIDHYVFAMLKSSQEEGIRKLMALVEKRETIIKEEPEKKRNWIPFMSEKGEK